MYDILIGENLREMILTKLIMQNSENYISHIHEMLRTIEPHPIIVELGEQVEKTINDTMSEYSPYYARGGGGFGGSAGKLVSEAFPPCIANTIKGVSSGGSNDAIVLLLTSFISYARLYPAIFGADTTV